MRSDNLDLLGQDERGAAHARVDLLFLNSPRKKSEAAWPTRPHLCCEGLLHALHAGSTRHRHTRGGPRFVVSGIWESNFFRISSKAQGLEEGVRSCTR